MKIVVVSNPEPVKKEANLVNALFKEGLELFHLRKPTYKERDYQDLLAQISPAYHSKIALHQYHHLTESFGISRIHLAERERLKTNEEDLRKWKERQFTLSTSIHSLDSYFALDREFSYAFLGPVFESISKKGYKPKNDKMIQLPENENRKPKIVAIGGITPDNIKEVKKANFDGVALLGIVWNDPENALRVYKNATRA